jgi:hypothetical protein
MNEKGESGWQRLKLWLDRQWGNARNPDSAVLPPKDERNDPPLAERVATWEDEGGSPAGSVSSVPAPPVNRKH